MERKFRIFFVVIIVCFVLVGVYITKPIPKKGTADVYYKKECIVIDKNLVCDSINTDSLYHIYGLDNLEIGDYIVVYHNGVTTLSFPQDFAFIDHIEVIEGKKAISEEVEILKMKHEKYFDRIKSFQKYIEEQSEENITLLEEQID